MVWESMRRMDFPVQDCVVHALTFSDHVFCTSFNNDSYSLSQQFLLHATIDRYWKDWIWGELH